MNFLKRLLPNQLLNVIRPYYHFFLAFFGALFYGFPSRKIKVVAVTGTKGKSSVTELVNAILEEAGQKTALANTLHFKIGNKEKKNLFKMTMPGRFFLQKFLGQAVREKCQYVVIEMTSEGSKQFRHKFINLDTLIFTNLSPEHIESHGSYENYVKAKLEIAKQLSKSNKKRRVLIINNDDKEAIQFKAIPNTEKIFYSIRDAENLDLKKDGTTFNWKDLTFQTKLIGEFNVYNILATLTFAESFGINLEKARSAIQKLEKIRGRVEKIKANGFEVVVDYAHTPDSLEKFYKAFPDSEKICVLGNTGGGRDRWKRPEMGKIADQYCNRIILTNEDPYDEDPKKIIEEMAVSIQKEKLKIILDRREAIREAIMQAQTNLKMSETVRLANQQPALLVDEPATESQKQILVLITGKGTDPFIMGPKGTKMPWDDVEVVREELERLENKKIN